MVTTQLCGMVILGIIIYFSLKQNRLRLTTNRVYLLTMANTILTLVFDVASIAAIVLGGTHNNFVAELLCKIYLVLLNNEAICGLIYTLTDVTVYYKNNNRQRIKSIIYLYAMIDAIAIMFSPIDMVYLPAEQILYIANLACTITYLCSFITIISTVLVCFIFKSTMIRSRYNSILTWMVLWMTGALIQLLNKELLIVSFTCVIGMMIIYFQLENPEKFIDSDSGYFNQQAFTAFTTQMYRENKNFSLLLICDTNAYSRFELSLEEIKALRNKYVSFLRQFTRLTFMYEHDKAILAFDDPVRCKEVLNEIIKASKKEFNGENELLRPMIYSLYDASIVNSSEALISILNYTFINLQHKKDKYNHTDINAETIESFNDESRIISMIHRAIKDDRIEVFYQPIYSTKHKRFTSAEALVRIRAEDGSIIPPGVFIDIVEKTNLIIKIGQVVFKKVCQFISENDMEALGIEYIEVNLSVIQCAYHSLAFDYLRIVKEYGIDTKYINLEITESASIDSKQILLGNMNKLISHGITFSLDDFGTGQSNLNYIMEMPVSLVKFDRDMINAYFENAKSQFIMRAAMSMITGLELKIVAEGVETEEQFNTLCDFGIDYIQGYYFSRPLPQSDFLEFIKENHVNG